MRAETRLALDSYARRIATLNGVNDPAKVFNVAPEVQQKLESKTQETSEFLSKVNMVGVSEMKGAKIGLGVSGPIASTTKRDGIAERKPVNPLTLEDDDYQCEAINYDTFLLYQQIDVWAKFSDFQTRLAAQILKRQSLDRIMIGWHGKRHAPTSDPVEFPMRDDVQKGWLQHYRDSAPGRVMETGKGGEGLIVGPSAASDYKNLDSLVFDARTSLLESWHKNRTDLVAICGMNLLADKYFPVIDVKQTPTETLAADIVVSQKRLGGLPAVEVPYFPEDAIFITPLSNLSIYWQIGARRRHLKEEPERNRIVNYESSNDAYVVEDYGTGCLVENIVLEDGRP